MRIAFAIGTFVVIAVAATFAQQPAPLRIVVIEGEGGVNIIQQKTAVRPLIEVRDSNNLPVAGASVTFTIGSGSGGSAAFAGGAQTLTVTTNAAGQAAASGLNALSSGALQIQVQAAYQGQIATAAISQSNFATAAAASQAGAAGGAAGGGGGGMSATTIGIVGAAVGGGALAATQVAKSGDDSDDGSGAETTNAFDGSVSGQLVVVSNFIPATGPPSTCTFTRNVTGTTRVELAQGNATGRASVQMSQTEISASSTCIPSTTPITFSLADLPVTGGPSALTFTGTAPVGISNYRVSFTGSLSGNTISGSLTLEEMPAAGANPSRSGSATYSVTLQGTGR